VGIFAVWEFEVDDGRVDGVFGAALAGSIDVGKVEDMRF
jgi:hypothetical protein